jgi:CheY-like chemotaxis protein
MPKRTSNNRCVLILEDEHMIRKSLKKSLRRQRLDVRDASSGRQALKLFNKQPRPSLVLCDIELEGDDDGIRAVEEMKRKEPALRVVYLTAFGNEQNRKRSAEAGITAEAWIDKNSKWLERAIATVTDTFALDEVSRRHTALCRWAKDEDIERAALIRLLKQLSPAEFDPKFAQKQQIAPPKPVFKRKSIGTIPLAEVIGQLRGLWDQVETGYGDIAFRDAYWESFQNVAKERLWTACVRQQNDRYRKQLVQQFMAAISKLQAHQLAPKTVTALRLALERLASDNISHSDVIQCDDAWRSAKVQTLPSFRQLLAKWETLYSVEAVNYQGK